MAKLKSDKCSSNPLQSYKFKLAISSSLFLCHFCMGLGMDFLGSSLLEMRNKFQTDIPTISKVFTVFTVSFLIGAFLGGILFNWVNRQLATVALVFMMGIGLICEGQVTSLWLFFASTSAFGFGCGGFETSQVVWIIEMWGKDSAPYIQAQHFTYAVGAFVSPLLVKPFLSIEGSEEETNSTNLDTSGNISSTLYVPFLVGGIIAFTGSLLILLLYCIDPYVKPPKEGDRKAEDATKTNEDTSLARKVILVFLSGSFLCFHVGMEVGTFQFMPTFAHFIDLNLSKQDGALILSGVTGAFVIGRGLGVPLVLKFSPKILLVANLILIAVGNTLLRLFANTSLPMLWTGAVFLGVGFSTVFPSFYGYIEKHLKISNFIGGVLIQAGWIASSIYPFIIGPIIETNPYVLTYTNYFSLGMCSLTLSILYCITRPSSKKNNLENPNTKTPI